MASVDAGREQQFPGEIGDRQVCAQIERILGQIPEIINESPYLKSRYLVAPQEDGAYSWRAFQSREKLLEMGQRIVEWSLRKEVHNSSLQTVFLTAATGGDPTVPRPAVRIECRKLGNNLRVVFPQGFSHPNGDFEEEPGRQPQGNALSIAQAFLDFLEKPF